MSVPVDCVLAKEIALYIQLTKHSVLGNKINYTTVKDSLLVFLDCLPTAICNPYIYNCGTVIENKCNILIRLDDTTSICKTPLIQLI